MLNFLPTVYSVTPNIIFFHLGSEFGYHPLTFGLYLDAIIRRVDSKRRSLSEYFREEIAKPLGKIT